MTNRYDLIIGIAWPVAVLLGIIILRSALAKLLSKDELSFQIPDGPVIKLSSNQAADTLSALFSDFHKVYDNLIDDYQQEVYRRILSFKKPPTVDEVIAEFSRDNPQHIGCLRALRGIGLIRPEDDKSWKNGSRIVVTRFGKSLNKYMKNSF